MLSLIFATIEDENDREFMEHFYDEYHRLMFFTARKYTENPYFCEEIVQESLLSLIKVVSLLRARAQPVRIIYLETTIRNTAYNYLKKEAREQSRTYSLEQNSFLEPEAEGLSMDELLILQEQQGRLSDIWEQLPAEDQLLLAGKHLLGASDAELAASIGCKPSSVRMKLTRARRKAMALMGGQTEGVMV